MSWKSFIMERSKKRLLCNSFEQRKTPVMFIRTKKMSTYTIVFPQQDPINLKWILPPRTLRESVKLENNLHDRNI